MKITKKILQDIIKEELEKALLSEKELRDLYRTRIQNDIKEKGVEAAHGVGVSNLDGLAEERVQVLVGVGVAATGHLEGDGMDLYAVPGLVVVDLGLHGLGEELVRDHSTSIVRKIPGDVDAGSSQAAGTSREDVEVLRGIALRIQDACCRVLGGCYRVVESRP